MIKSFLLTTVIAFFILSDMKAQVFLRINKSDGTVVEVAITDIQKITFDNLVALPSQNQVVKQLMKMKLFPNPAREHVNIEYSLPNDGGVTLEIFNLNGQLMMTTNRGIQSAGEHYYSWPVTNIISGTYLCIITQNQEIMSKKVIIENKNN